MGIPDCMPYYQLQSRYPRRWHHCAPRQTMRSTAYVGTGDSILREEVPEVAQYSIDEAFLDLEGMDGIDLAEWGAQSVSQGTAVYRHTGEPRHSPHQDPRQGGQ